MANAKCRCKNCLVVNGGRSTDGRVAHMRRRVKDYVAVYSAPELAEMLCKLEDKHSELPGVD